VSNRAAIAKRMTRPCIEALEDRALLSSLAVSLTTDMPVYQPGQPIEFTFTETNNGTHPVQVVYGPVNDGFDVTQSGSLVWQSNAGVNPMFLRLDTLEPGQSVVLHDTWNGVPNQSNSTTAAVGTFTVTNQLDPTGASATFQIASSPSDPIAPPPPELIAPAVTATLATGRSIYQIGHRVSLTLTLTNSGSQPVAVDPLSSTAGFTLARGSTVVWRSPGTRLAARAVQSLAPGQSIEIRRIWMGIPNQHGVKTLMPGLYQVEGSAGGYTAAATIRITAPSTQ